MRLWQLVSEDEVVIFAFMDYLVESETRLQFLSLLGLMFLMMPACVVVMPFQFAYQFIWKWDK